jgi:hypothetical protein
MNVAPDLHPALRRSSLVMCIVSALATATPAIAVKVTDCGDAGPGTLREALLTESLIDVSACTQITITSGELTVSFDNVLIAGDQANHTLITASGTSRVLSHTGAATLSLTGLDIADGTISGVNVAGGCIASQGTVTLYRTTVRECTVTGQTNVQGVGEALGGGIYARDSVTLDHSVVRDNTLVKGPSGYNNAFGGGVFSRRDIVMRDSTISGNVVIGDSGYAGGGGANAKGGVSITNSTISGNDAPIAGGALFGNALSTSSLVNATVSGNHASDRAAGLGSSDATLNISNSTIAFNKADHPLSGPPGGAGLWISGFNNAHVFVRSSIIARNARAGEADDVGTSGPVTVLGSNNLIMASSAPMPGDTILVDPMLAPLANNGGRVETHALGAGSPAIDSGDNFLPTQWDARGDGFERVAGAAADIGAYEVQEALLLDRIFEDGFD